MRDALKKGLELYSEAPSKGVVSDTLRLARSGLNTGSWPEEKIVKADNWFARHVFDRKRMKEPRKWDDPPKYSPAYIAWLLWGSDSDNRGRRWISKQADMVRASQKKENTGASTPAPPEDRIKGGRNTGKASSPSKSEIQLSKATNAALSKKAKDHNDDVGSDRSKRATLSKLQKVYLRGAGAFSTSHRPGMTRGQWALGRVNAFLYLLKNGKPENDKYITDNDLLPSGHPKYSKRKEALNMEGYKDKKLMSGHMEKKMLAGVLRMVCHDIYSIIDMMDEVDNESLKDILMATHDRYAALAGKEPSPMDVDVDVEVEPELDDKYSYRRPSMMSGKEFEAVDDPSARQRSNLPSSAYEPAAWFADEDGGFSPDGDFLSSKSKLPHHINTVNDPNENSTVDVPRLRNAMARFGQVDWSGFPEETRIATKAHLERHADALLYGNDEAECACCSNEELMLLQQDLNDFRDGKYSNISKRAIQ